MKKLIVAVCLAASVLGGSASMTLAADGTSAAKHYANCTALNKVYPHGVGKPGAKDHVSGSSKPVTNFTKNLALYNANSGSDRDKDGIACEKL